MTIPATQKIIFLPKGEWGAGADCEDGVETGSGSEITAAWFYNRLRAKSATCSPSGNKAVVNLAGSPAGAFDAFYNIRSEVGPRASQFNVQPGNRDSRERGSVRKKVEAGCE